MLIVLFVHARNGRSVCQEISGLRRRHSSINYEGHPQFAGMYAGGVSEPKTRKTVEGADLVLDLGGVNLNDITTAAYSGQLDLSRFITVGLEDVRIGDQIVANVRLADVLSELAKLKPSSAPTRENRSVLRR
jgi:indolepyruvate decarboxylase